MFCYISKHLEVLLKYKYSTAHRIFNSLFSIWNCDEAISFMFGILLKKCLRFSPAPTGPPLNLRAIANSSSSIILYWLSPSIDQQNGEIISYNIRLRGKDSLQTVINTKNNLTTLPITGLQAYTNYEFVIQAVNDVGVSPYSSPVTSRTFEAGKRDLIHDICHVSFRII